MQILDEGNFYKTQYLEIQKAFKLQQKELQVAQQQALQNVDITREIVAK